MYLYAVAESLSGRFPLKTNNNKNKNKRKKWENKQKKTHKLIKEMKEDRKENIYGVTLSTGKGQKKLCRKQKCESLEEVKEEREEHEATEAGREFQRMMQEGRKEDEWEELEQTGTFRRP